MPAPTKKFSRHAPSELPGQITLFAPVCHYKIYRASAISARFFAQNRREGLNCRNWAEEAGRGAGTSKEGRKGGGILDLEFLDWRLTLGGIRPVVRLSKGYPERSANASVRCGAWLTHFLPSDIIFRPLIRQALAGADLLLCHLPFKFIQKAAYSPLHLHVLAALCEEAREVQPHV